MRAKASSSSNGSDEHGKREKRRRRSPAVLMEGSRCSRVNGRGWRCCQPTLVGYSLCEHHLGKGARLRSVSSVRGRLGCSTKKGVGDGPSTTTKIATTVKARSISSLLDVESDDTTHSESLSSSSSLPPPPPNAATSKGEIAMLWFYVLTPLMRITLCWTSDVFFCDFWVRLMEYILEILSWFVRKFCFSFFYYNC